MVPLLSLFPFWSALLKLSSPSAAVPSPVDCRRHNEESSDIVIIISSVDGDGSGGGSSSSSDGIVPLFPSPTSSQSRRSPRPRRRRCLRAFLHRQTPPASDGEARGRTSHNNSNGRCTCTQKNEHIPRLADCLSVWLAGWLARSLDRRACEQASQRPSVRCSFLKSRSGLHIPSFKYRERPRVRAESCFDRGGCKRRRNVIS